MKMELILPKTHPNQKKIIRCDSRFRVVAAGRRFGKTTVGQHEIIAAAFKNKQTCWWLAPTYAMSSQVWRDIKAICRNLPGMSISETEQRIDFHGGGSLTIRSTHLPDNLRGAGLDLVVLDEAAFMDPSVWPEVVRPMLLDRKGRALFLSSPNGKNWFWQLYQMGVQRKRSWRQFHFTSYENPILDPDDLEAIQYQTPERIWRQEYLAEFVDDLGQVFRAIREAATAPLNAEPIPERRYACGLDWGREVDFTAIVVIDSESRQMVALDRFHGVSWSLQRGRLKAIVERWNPVAVWAEANSIGSPNIEALQSEGLPVRPFMTTAASKSPVIEALALAIERAELALLPDETLLDELAAYTYELLPSGGYRYTAPPGLHDDLVIATALAWHGARHSSLPISFV
jgi:phage terminase large subunit-like protein